MLWKLSLHLCTIRFCYQYSFARGVSICSAWNTAPPPPKKIKKLKNRIRNPSPRAWIYLNKPVCCLFESQNPGEHVNFGVIFCVYACFLNPRKPHHGRINILYWLGMDTVVSLYGIYPALSFYGNHNPRKQVPIRLSTLVAPCFTVDIWRFELCTFVLWAIIIYYFE